MPPGRDGWRGFGRRRDEDAQHADTVGQRVRGSVRHDHHVASLGGLVNRCLDQPPQGLRVGSPAEVDRTDRPERHDPGGTSGDGEIAHQPVDHLRPALGVRKFRDRHATRLGGPLQDLLVDQLISQLVGNRLADQFAARADQPCNTHHPSRHRRTVGAAVPTVKERRCRVFTAGSLVVHFSAISPD